MFLQNYVELEREARINGQLHRIKYIATTCMRALYYAVLFTRGYGFNSDSHQILAIDKIEGQPLGQFETRTILMNLSRIPSWEESFNIPPHSVNCALDSLR
jgi:hypothetical protein